MSVRPTLDELRDRFGKDWGITAKNEMEEIMKAARRVQIGKANDVLFQRECEAAGMDPTQSVSPSLIKLMQKTEAA